MNMQLSKYISKSKKCISTEMGEDAILLNLETGKYIKLNESASIIWKKIEGEIKISVLKQEVASYFKVGLELINDDIDLFIEEAILKKIIIVK